MTRARSARPARTIDQSRSLACFRIRLGHQRPYSDKTQINNYLTFQWSKPDGIVCPRTRLVEVFVNNNGGKLNYSSDYRGIYVLMEKIKIDDNRVDIAELSPNDNAEPDITGGYIWKKDKAAREIGRFGLAEVRSCATSIPMTPNHACSVGLADRSYQRV